MNHYQIAICTNIKRSLDPRAVFIRSVVCAWVKRVPNRYRVVVTFKDGRPDIDHTFYTDIITIDFIANLAVEEISRLI